MPIYSHSNANTHTHTLTNRTDFIFKGNSFGNNPPIGNRNYGGAPPNHSGVGHMQGGAGGNGDWGGSGQSSQGGKHIENVQMLNDDNRYMMTLWSSTVKNPNWATRSSVRSFASLTFSL